MGLAAVRPSGTSVDLASALGSMRALGTSRMVGWRSSTQRSTISGSWEEESDVALIGFGLLNIGYNLSGLA
jgi:hypothetical protein